MARPIKRKWFPKNPDKYKGDPNNIISRSSWEKRFFDWCDMNSSIVAWASEEIIVPYLDETSNKMRRYFVDAIIKVKDVDENIKTFLVEIKPYKECHPPKYPGRQTKRYLTEVETFVKNQCKWKHARSYAQDRKWEFIILTERELFENGKV